MKKQQVACHVTEFVFPFLFIIILLHKNLIKSVKSELFYKNLICNEIKKSKKMVINNKYYIVNRI